MSTATVSNALNGTGRLSEATRQRVLAAARELGYSQASTARALAGGGTGALGPTMTTFGDLPFPYMRIPRYAQLTLGAMAAAHERGYTLMAMQSSLSP
ncbi:LacI family DNA-binding transcriptional regulator [Streptomyces scabiei]|uniref:LacI family DNA-binding transcriptional regulator n=1 Tax=Streptomyces scabiei TaxID=1930 RepID=UPI0036AE9022